MDLTPRKPGRPKGAKTNPIVHAVAQPSRCPACGSTERSPYLDRHEQEFAGIDKDGNSYTHIVRRRTRCLGCGQHRVDRVYDNRVQFVQR